jgi:NO-binding membrane sensor protein with MHYT domain
MADVIPESTNELDSGRYTWDAAAGRAAAVTEPEKGALPQEVYSRKEALPLLYRPAIWLLGGIGAVCVIGMIAVPLLGQQVSDGLIAIGSLAVGALANMIARESGGDGK